MNNTPRTIVRVERSGLHPVAKVGLVGGAAYLLWRFMRFGSGFGWPGKGQGDGSGQRGAPKSLLPPFVFRWGSEKTHQYGAKLADIAAQLKAGQSPPSLTLEQAIQKVKDSEAAAAVYHFTGATSVKEAQDIALAYHRAGLRFFRNEAEYQKDPSNPKQEISVTVYKEVNLPVLRKMIDEGAHRWPYV